MKTLPIVLAGLTIKDKHNTLLSESLRQNAKKMNRLILVTPPEQKAYLSELIAQRENIDFSEKIKQMNKKIFGK